MAIVEPWAAIIAYWRRSNIPIRSGVRSQQVAEFQSKYGVTIPCGVLEYLDTVDGMSTDDMDNELFRFWPLAEIRPVHEELNDSAGVIYPDRFAYPNCFVFADYLISCWLYAVRLTSDPLQPAPVYRVTAGATPGEQMASSFREFMANYARDPSSVV